MIRVLIAEDQPTVRAGLAMILAAEPGLAVVGTAGDGAEAIARARELRPDVTVMDIRMPGVDGIEATRVLTAERLTEVLVLTTFDTDRLVFGALRAGAAGYLLKDTDPQRLVDAVRVVAAGDGMVAPGVTRRLIAAFAARPYPPAAPPGLDELTPRERQVLVQLGHGASNAELAAALGIAEPTAKTHVHRVLAKLSLGNRAQAAILARELGLAADGPPPK
ncbi:response regulator [Actinocatenispora thailandica]|uniref:response regulator n=1 Tax=Actinocatenispora thailandica TaxID=227318 RepID=UPI00194ED21C|nr:response regulator transcription factor [Actinocatenispora thailandica]